jgi:GntR family transcriptional regulator
VSIVDPANPIPKYLQIASWLKECVQSGKYTEGGKLPSELELSAMCAVNRNTLRQAIANLVAAGILRKEKGMGTFVASATPIALKHKLEQITSFKDDLLEIGIREKTILLEKSIKDANDKVARTLNLKSNSKVVVVQRLRTGNNIPFIYEESYLPADMFHNILGMDLTTSMYQIISEQFNVVLDRCQQTLQAINLTGKIARYLDLAPHAAGLYMESLTYNESNIPVEMLCSYYRGDKYIFEVELGQYHIMNGNSANSDHDYN